MEQQQVLADQMVQPYPEKPNVDFRNAFSPNVLQKIQQKVAPVKHDIFRAMSIGKKQTSAKWLLSHFGNRGYYDLGLKVDRHIVRFYGYDLHRLPQEDPIWKERYATLFSRAHAFWVEGPFMQQQLMEMGLSQEKITVLPLGVNCASIHFETRMWPEKDQPLNLLIAGTFKEKKGVVEALETCKLLLKGGMNLQVHLVGNELNATPNDVIYSQKVFDELASPALQKVVKHHGLVSRSDLQAIARKCHLGLLPSRFSNNGDCEGGYPVLFLDVMATGLPLVSTKHCDIPFIIDKDCGILVEKADPYALASTISQMAQNPEQLASLSDAARQKVSQSFDWPKLQKRYLAELPMT